MLPSDPVLLGFFLPPAIGLAARGVLFFIDDLPNWLEKRKAKESPDDRAAFIHKQLVAKYQKEGNPDPWRAASDELSMLRHIEEFRREACVEYVKGVSLDEARDAWWKRRSKDIQHVASLGRDKADGLKYAKVLIDAIAKTPPSEIYIYGAAAEKWQAEMAKEEAEIAALRSRPQKRDDIYESVINGLWMRTTGKPA